MGLWNKITNFFRGRGFAESPTTSTKLAPIQNTTSPSTPLYPTSTPTTSGASTETPIQQTKPVEKNNNLQIQQLTDKKPVVNKKETVTKINDDGMNEIVLSDEKNLSVQDVQNQIKNNGNIGQLGNALSQTQFRREKFVISNNPATFYPVYQQLFSDGVISLRTADGEIDNELVDVLIKNRRNLQHRFVTTFFIELSNGITSELKCFGLLPDDAHLISSFVYIGQEFGTEKPFPNITTALDQAGNSFKKQGQCTAYTSTINGTGSPPYSIIKIEQEVSFA